MLDQPEEVGPGGSHRAADVVLAQPLELPQHRLADPAQIVEQVGLRESVDHGRRGYPPPAVRRVSGRRAQVSSSAGVLTEMRSSGNPDTSSSVETNVSRPTSGCRKRWVYSAGPATSCLAQMAANSGLSSVRRRMSSSQS